MNNPRFDLTQRDRYLSELVRLRAKDRQLVTMREGLYEGKLMRCLRDIDERIAATRSNAGKAAGDI